MIYFLYNMSVRLQLKNTNKNNNEMISIRSTNMARSETISKSEAMQKNTSHNTNEIEKNKIKTNEIEKNKIKANEIEKNKIKTNDQKRSKSVTKNIPIMNTKSEVNDDIDGNSFDVIYDKTYCNTHGDSYGETYGDTNSDNDEIDSDEIYENLVKNISNLPTTCKKHKKSSTKKHCSNDYKSNSHYHNNDSLIKLKYKPLSNIYWVDTNHTKCKYDKLDHHEYDCSHKSDHHEYDCSHKSDHHEYDCSHKSDHHEYDCSHKSDQDKSDHAEYESITSDESDNSVNESEGKCNIVIHGSKNKIRMKNCGNTINYYCTPSKVHQIIDQNCSDNCMDNCANEFDHRITFIENRLEEMMSKIGNDLKCKNPPFIMIDKNQTIRFKEPARINYTIVGGGGAGGMGICFQYMYIYGGGGAAGDGRSGIMDVEKGEVWQIGIGKGGSSKNSLNGGNTLITSYKGTEVKWSILVNGGMNGSPSFDMVKTIMNFDQNVDKLVDTFEMNKIVKGGCEREGDIIKSTTKNGQDGGVGLISIPASAGKGGFTEVTGQPGTGGNIQNIYGTDGSHGSGGGGAMCNDHKPTDLKFSGNGGDGYVIISVVDTLALGQNESNGQSNGQSNCLIEQMTTNIISPKIIVG